MADETESCSPIHSPSAGSVKQNAGEHCYGGELVPSY